MTVFLFLVAMATALGVCLVQLSKPYGYLTYPFLAGVFCLAWLAPQFLIVLGDPWLPDEGRLAMSLMILLSLAAVLGGWRLGCDAARARLDKIGLARNDALSTDGSALIVPTMALTAVAIGARIMLASMRLDPNLTTQWSGPIVIVVTVAGIRVIPLYLSLMLALRRQSPVTLGLAAVNLLLSGSFAFVDIGRSEAIDLALISCLALWFTKRIRIGLPLLAAGGAAATIFVFTVGEFRAAANDHFLMTGERVSVFNPAVWRSIDFATATERSASRAPDIRNAVYLMTYRQEQGGYTLGTRLWDDMAFRWVPAQIVGKDLKSALMFQKDPDVVYDRILDDYDYERITGTTSTGFGAAFSEFWYFGALAFGAYAWIAGRWWTLGSRGDLWAQVLYASTLGSGLVNFTHEVYWVWLGLPLLLAGILIVKAWLWASRSRASVAFAPLMEGPR